MVFIGYQKIRSDSECESDDEEIGTFSTVYECFNKCNSTTGCRYFEYGKEQSVQGQCWWEKTTNENCPEGWQDDQKYDFYKIGILMYK